MGSRTWAAVLPGFLFTGMLASWLCWAPPGAWQHSLVPAMLLFFPLWVAVICLCLAASHARQAWWFTTVPAAIGLALLWWVQSAGWLQ